MSSGPLSLTTLTPTHLLHHYKFGKPRTKSRNPTQDPTPRHTPTWSTEGCEWNSPRRIEGKCTKEDTGPGSIIRLRRNLPESGPLGSDFPGTRGRGWYPWVHDRVLSRSRSDLSRCRNRSQGHIVPLVTTSLGDSPLDHSLRSEGREFPSELSCNWTPV